jgi:hypothetical protein
VDGFPHLARAQGSLRLPEVSARVRPGVPAELGQDHLAAKALAEVSPHDPEDHEQEREAEASDDDDPDARVRRRAAEVGEEAGEPARDDVDERDLGVTRALLADVHAKARLRRARIDGGRPAGPRLQRRDVREGPVERSVRGRDPLGERGVVDGEGRAVVEAERGRLAQQRARAVDERLARWRRGGARRGERGSNGLEPFPVALPVERVRVGGRRLRDEARGDRERERQPSRGNASAASCRSNPSLRTRRS